MEGCVSLVTARFSVFWMSLSFGTTERQSDWVFFGPQEIHECKYKGEPLKHEPALKVTASSSSIYHVLQTRGIYVVENNSQFTRFRARITHSILISRDGCSNDLTLLNNTNVCVDII